MATIKCIKHPVDSLEVYDADKFQFICNKCQTIITKQDKRTFDLSVEMVKFLQMDLTSVGVE